MDKSLDDIIKEKGGRGYRGGGGRGRGGRDNRSAGGALRRVRTTARSAPYRASRLDDKTQWSHDRFEEVLEEEEEGGWDTAPSSNNNNNNNNNDNGRLVGIQTGTKILVSNLDFNVSDGDVRDLFESIGDVKHSAIHYDKSGRSLGTANVVYARRSDAIAAVKKYNGVPLDGQPMKITIVGTNVAAPGTFDRGNNNNNNNYDAAQRFRRAVKEANVTVSLGGRARRVVSSRDRPTRRTVTLRRGGGGGGSRGRRGGGGGGRQVGKAPTRAELDADIDAYSQMDDETA